MANGNTDALIELADSIEIFSDETASSALRHLRSVIRKRKEIEKRFEKDVKDKFAAHKKATADRNNRTKPWTQAEGTLRVKVNDWLTKQAELAEEAAMRGECVSSLIPEEITYAIADGFFDVQIESAEEFIKWAVKNERFDFLTINGSSLKKAVDNTGGTLRANGMKVSRKYRVKIST